MADDLSERLVDALCATYGTHPGHRAAHAKGVLCAATFTAMPDAADLTVAPHFQGDTLRAHVRFSNGSGDPASPDGERDGRGMALKIYLSDGGTTDILGITLPVFFVRTPEDLIAFNEARRPDPETGALDMEKVAAFLAAHPEAVPAVTAAITAPAPASYAQLRYHALHAFRFVARDGSGRYGRCHLIPDADESGITDEEAAARPADYLARELVERLDEGPVGFALDLEFAGEGDAIDDPTVAWPDDRERVRIAHVEITGLAFDREQDGDVLVFDPCRVVDGIELTSDPVLRARPGAYAVAVARRTAPTIATRD